MGTRNSHGGSSSNPERQLLEEPASDRSVSETFTVTIAPDVNLHRDSFSAIQRGDQVEILCVYSAKAESLLKYASCLSDLSRSPQTQVLPPAFTAKVSVLVSNPNIILELSPVGNQGQRQISYLRWSQEAAGLRVKLTLQQLIISGKVLTIFDIYGAKVRGIHEDEQLECVVCMTESRCSIVLPCRHLCLCTGCSDVMRSQGQPKCPMCRCELEAVVQVSTERRS